MKLLVLLNHAAGVEALRTRIVERFASEQAEAQVRLLEPGSLDEQVRDAVQSDVDAILAAGENGVSTAVVNALARAGRKPFGVLPTGSQNFFARELGIPLEMDQAIAALARGTIAERPVAEMNGRIFLNLSTIGLHAPARNLVLSTRGRTIARHASEVVVCSNPHQLRAIGIEPGAKAELDLLNVYVASPPPSKNALQRMLRERFGIGERAAAHFVSMPLPELHVDGPSRGAKIVAVVDGDVVRVRGPIIYRIRPVPLRILLPGPVST
jgi:hypothetical protein